jgi:hypothetical protein
VIRACKRQRDAGLAATEQESEQNHGDQIDWEEAHNE